MLSTSAQNSRLTRARGRYQEIVESVESLYSDDELKERSEDPSRIEARAAVICTLVACGMDEGKLQDFMDCSLKEIKTSLERYSREKNSGARFATNMQLLLRRFDPKSPQVRDTGGTFLTLEHITSAVWKEFRITLNQMQSKKPQTDIRRASAALAVLLYHLSGMQRQAIEAHLHQEPGYLEEASALMREAAPPDSQWKVRLDLRARLDRICRTLGTTTEEMFDTKDITRQR